MLPKKTEASDHSLYSVSEERLNTATHALGFLLSVTGLIFLLQKTTTLPQTLSAWVYGVSLALMFLSSSIYHVVTRPALKVILRKVDHSAIYLLIAGSYTPFMLLSVSGQMGTIALIAIWVIGLSGILFKILVGHKYPKLAVSTYALMGWFALLLIYPLYQSLSGAGFTLLLVGGLCYSAGIPLYMLKSRHYSHALWHLFVVAGAACHFFAIYYHVIGE
ncbi:PAQR family membrane homeostasis protein TrhA [Alteromonas oceanisediminis]|uniref:PAQR family membrane homeostasis protein TrhA n=1 Tax=Alteromonas oceanisediminis TaxID=2836180 RepID=UPI001BDA5075|nr:hemolysin III family protein [Alteromonas oceanisediminis]MBT0587389.1 hemolysin III family protein [Alteromonas oceanisediminis]